MLNSDLYQICVNIDRRALTSAYISSCEFMLTNDFGCFGNLSIILLSQAALPAVHESFPVECFVSENQFQGVSDTSTSSKVVMSQPVNRKRAAPKTHVAKTLKTESPKVGPGFSKSVKSEPSSQIKQRGQLVSV